MKQLWALFFPVLAWASPCPDFRVIDLETDEEVRFCLHAKLQISYECLEKKKTCPMLKDLQKNAKMIRSLDAMASGHKQNPGSLVCNRLGWKVLMGKLDESEVCVCVHPLEGKILCTSFLEF
jgi:hypothetical protein